MTPTDTPTLSADAIRRHHHELRDRATALRTELRHAERQVDLWEAECGAGWILGSAPTIRAAREAHGLSKTALARRAGLHRSTIHRAEAGLSSMDCVTTVRLARALRITVDTLLGLSEPLGG
jgi:DNA-binding XRE family transcriptional regulator